MTKCLWCGGGYSAWSFESCPRCGAPSPKPEPEESTPVVGEKKLIPAKYSNIGMRKPDEEEKRRMPGIMRKHK